MIKPFSEVSLYEQNNISNPFYGTGSSPTMGDGTFDSALHNKTQIHMSFVVKNKTTMLGNSASIYYFNPGAGQWTIPSTALFDHTGPFDKVRYRTELFAPAPAGTTLGSLYLQDEIGFDSGGNAIASGNLASRRQVSNPAAALNDTALSGSFLSNTMSVTEMMTVDRSKSVQRSVSYDAETTQTFELPITDPFLIEKIVFEIPLCAGDSWFRDKTTTCIAWARPTDTLVDGSPFSSGQIFFNSGGPGLSLALFCQKNFGPSKIRDLICQNVITHSDDLTDQNTLTLGLKRLEPTPPSILVGVSTLGINLSTTQGSSSYITTISATSNPYTGSALIESECSVSNGVVCAQVVPNSNANLVGALAELDRLLQSKTLTDFNYTMPVHIDPFGRGMTGFMPSGGSIFGKEHVSAQGSVDNAGNIKLNPFYVADPAQRSQIVADFTAKWSAASIGSAHVWYMTRVALSTRAQSPYLIYPREKLVLAMAKHRPAINQFRSNVSTTNPNDVRDGVGTMLSSSYYHDLGNTLGHDVQLNTGSINITFYGSYVKAGGQYVP